MNYTVDTVIIGGGPSGIACAISLQKNNISNLVIEKKSFPRDKTCGGLVTNKTFNLLVNDLCLHPSDIETVICDESNVVELYHKDRMLTRSVVSKNLRFVKRSVLDSALASKYKELGGKLLENSCCASIDLSNRVIVLTNKDTVAFKHIVVADGALSSTRAMLGYKKPKLGFCVETHIPKSKLPYDGAVRICFGLVKNGYAWIFPSGNEWCIGLGGVYKKGTQYDRILKQFLASLHLDPNDCVLKGAFVPYGKTVKQNRGSDDVILVGDAGGFVDPIYGEGLYFAVASGIEAANAIMSGIPKIRPEFVKRTSPFMRIIQQGNLLQNFFFQASVLKLFKTKIRGKDTFISFYCDHQVSDYNYSYSKLLKLCYDYKQRRKNSRRI